MVSSCKTNTAPAVWESTCEMENDSKKSCQDSESGENINELHVASDRADTAKELEFTEADAA